MAITSEDIRRMKEADAGKPANAFTLVYHEGAAVWDEGVFLSLNSSVGGPALFIGNRHTRLVAEGERPYYDPLDESTARVRRTRVGVNTVQRREGDDRPPLEFPALAGVDGDVEELLLHVILPRGEGWGGVQAGTARLVLNDERAGEALLAFGKGDRATVFLPDGEVIAVEACDESGDLTFASANVPPADAARLRIEHASGELSGGRLEKIEDDERRAKATDYWEHQLLAASEVEGVGRAFLKRIVYTPMLAMLEEGKLRPGVVYHLRKVVEAALPNEVGAFDKAVEAAKSSGQLLADKPFMRKPRGSGGVPAWRKKQIADRAADDRANCKGGTKKK